jgi:GAF domain-containing protein
VPMMFDETAIGAMLVHTTYRRHFTDTEQGFLGVLANQTAVAIQNVWNYERLERLQNVPDIA